MHNNAIARIMAVVMLISVALAPATPALAQDDGADPGDDPAQRQLLSPERQSKPRVLDETDHGGAELARYTVLLESASLALYRGGTNGLAATNPTQTGANRLALETDASAAYTRYLATEQATALDGIASTIGRTPEVIFTYRVTLNGFTLEMTPQEAHQIVAQEGVQSVQRAGLYELHTDAGPAWIGAPAIWDGSGLPDGQGSRGEGIVVGVLDTGINMDHPSFATVSGDGYINTNPRGKQYGVCDLESEVYVDSFICNDKLIGGWDFIDSGVGPVDNHGHGSHTASTAAGNRVLDAVMNTPTYQYEAPISGVAPHANIIAYKVCMSFGCPFDAIQAGIEQATIDQVDVINFSIGGGPENPWGDSMAMAFLAASEAGVTVVTSAGNSGPQSRTIGSPANAPWLISVGASSHNRKPVSSLIDLSGGDTVPPAGITGKGLSEGYGPAPIVYAGLFGNPYCYGYTFEPNTFSNEIVLCDRGGGGRVSKGKSVRDAGGKALVLTNGIFDRAATIADPHVIPAIHISYIDGLRLKLWLITGSGHTATISGTTIDLATENGDIMASFSSRGPNRPLPDVIKPDLTAPGVDIFAAYKAPEEFSFVNGTSMSSPHVAGAAALVKAVYPAWTPAEIKSALMATGQPEGVRKEDANTAGDPFDSGAGRVDLTGAARTGFVLDESGVNFENANPRTNGDPAALNLPSLAEDECIATCSWTRVLKSTQDSPVNWTVDTESDDGMGITVDPSNFTLTASGVQTITITANATVETLGHWAFGRVNFTPGNAALATAHFPVAVYSSAGDLADINLQTRRNQGAYTIKDIVTISMDDLVTTIYADRPEEVVAQVGADWSISSPYQNLDSVAVTWTLRSVTDTTKIFVAAISESTAPDLDLYVGIDADKDGRPSPQEELCVPFTYGSDERCEFQAPLDGGDYWIMVHSYYGSGAEMDEFLLSTLIVDKSDITGITASGPPAVEGGAPFDLMINWDMPEMESGDTYTGVIEMSNKSSDNVVLAADITLTRQEDDVQLRSNAGGVWPGRTVPYAFDVMAESAVPGSVTNYTFVATLPAGMTYAPGSASTEPTSVAGNTITWENVDILKGAYVMSDNDHDPLCNTFIGGYINLENYYIDPHQELAGDDFFYDIDGFFHGTDPYSFYGVEYPSFYVTANGFGTFDPDVGEHPGVNSDLPDPARPNSLIAPFWRDLEVVYDVVYDDYYFTPLILRGVSIAGTWGGEEMVIEYDDVEPAPAGSTQERYDFEIVLRRAVDDTPGVYEIVLAYDNLNGALTPATIGIENADGSAAQKYAHNDAQLRDGFMICYDWTTPTTTITFQATVDEVSAAGVMETIPLVTTLDHTVNVDGYLPAREEVKHEFYVGPIEQFFLPVVGR